MKMTTAMATKTMPTTDEADHGDEYDNGDGH